MHQPGISANKKLKFHPRKASVKALNETFLRGVLEQPREKWWVVFSEAFPY
jgi:hypothetical protein